MKKSSSSCAGIKAFILAMAAFASTAGTALALAPLEAWRLQYFGTTENTNSAADGADPDGDHIPNLMEYALGLDPLVSSTNPVTADITTGYLRMTIPRNSNAWDVTISVEVSGDLSDPLGWTTNGTTVDQDTPTLLQVHDNTPVPGATARFMRLRVTDLGISAPSAPLNVTAGNATNRSATVSWTAPDNHGSAITSYDVTFGVPGVTTNVPATSNAMSVTITGLSNCVAYTFSVVANNAAGAGPPSAASNPVTPTAPPDAPTQPSLSFPAGSGAQLAASWTAPRIRLQADSEITGPSTVFSFCGSPTGM